MQLKRYQQAALDALRTFLEQARDGDPETAFANVKQSLELGRYDSEYHALKAMPNTPYVCIRIPTGGGKTMLGAHAVRLAGASFLEKDFPVALWLTPSNTIRRQTVEALKDARHAYRRVLDDAFEGRVRVFDIAEFEQIRPTDMRDGACVIVGTIQTLRVQNTEGRRVYKSNENLEPHFAHLRHLFTALEKDENGRVKCSLANLLYAHEPLLVVDEAHNAVTGLTRDMQARINPKCIVEFTATPRPHSNVLFSVSASALKDEEMIKLPVMLTAHSGWQAAVAAAIRERARLAAEANAERSDLRPIVLFQAQNKDQDVRADVLRQHLIDNEQIEPERIAVVTGDQRELDGVDLFDPTCPIEYVITVQALKEGWDCSFAYVFCSLANVRSKTDIEQLLGRVLRMPYASRRANEDLNRAYAHVCEPNFIEAAVALRDRLVDMGFETEEAEDNIRTPELLLEGGADAAEPPPAIVFEPLDAAAIDKLPGDVRGALEVRTHDGVTEVHIVESVPPEGEDAVLALAPESKRDEVRKALVWQRAWIARRDAPATRGEKFAVPQLCFELEPAEPDMFLHLGGWRLTDCDAQLSRDEFNRDRGYQSFELDMARQAARDQVTYRAAAGAVGDYPALTGLAAPWDERVLARWLDRECRQRDIRQVDLLEFARRAVADLMDRRKLPLDVLIYAKYRLAKSLRQKIAACRREAANRGYQDCLFAPGAPVEASFDYAFDFVPGHYPARWFYNGSYRFSKHYYHRVGELKNRGEEFECARALDMTAEVRYWVRNLEKRDDASFRLPRACSWFYPDFVALLDDGRLLVVEYKGEQLVDKTSEKEKASVGALWEVKSAGRALFLMAEKSKDGADASTQIRNKIKGS
jgi:type III restriction enzyme